MFVLADIRRGRARSDGCDVSQAGAAAVVTTNGRGLPGRKHQKLHQLVARRQSLQRHPAQKQVGVTSSFLDGFLQSCTYIVHERITSDYSVDYVRLHACTYLTCLSLSCNHNRLDSTVVRPLLFVSRPTNNQLTFFCINNTMCDTKPTSVECDKAIFNDIVFQYQHLLLGTCTCLSLFVCRYCD